MKTIRISHARVAHQIRVLVFAIILCQVGLLEAEEKEGGDAFIERIEGSLTNVMGLPMELLGRMMGRFSR